MTTTCATELLQGRASGPGERFITAGAPATRISDFLRVGIALGVSARTGFGVGALADPLAVAARLGSPSAFPLFARSITTVGGSLPAAAGRRAASRTAITDKRAARLEGPLTILQKTDATAQTPRDVLHRSRFSATLRWAHGELPLPAGQVSLRSVNFAARRFYFPPLLLRRTS